MDTDRNLRFAVEALKAQLITAEQFVEACKLWSERGDRSMADLLADRGWLTPNARGHVDRIIGDIKNEDGLTAAFLAPRADDGISAPKHAAAAMASQAPTALAERSVPRPPPSPFDSRYARQTIHAVGGMGRIWLARDTQLNRDVALKELRPEVADDSALKSRFLREARITGQLEHPGIVPVYEVAWELDTHQPYYTMRFVRGRTLNEAAKEFHRRRFEGRADPLELVSLLSAFAAVCNTIAYAHSHRIIHRDLKGENVLLGAFGEVVVLDWGLAKSLDTPDDVQGPSILDQLGDVDNTVQGDVIGTPGFMAPEQAEGRLDRIDHRTDIFGLGAMLYEVLTGQAPFTGGDTLAVIVKAQRAEPPPPRTIWPQVPPALETACLRALAKEPTDRYQSAAELAQAVHTWQEVQRRQAEDALQRQTEILQSILNSMGEGVVVADEAGKLLLINHAAERILGRQPVGAALQESRLRVDLYLPDMVTPCPPEQRPLSRAVRGEIIDDVELYVRVPGKAGGTWMSASGRPLKDNAGQVKGGLVVVRDISERKRAEEELRRSRERFELAVRGSQDGLWDWDLQTDEVYYSPRWKSIIGYEDDEIAHHINEWEVRLHPDERERVVAANVAHINGATPYYEYEYRLRHKDGSYRWILARGVALRDAKGKAYRMAGSHVDVTARKQAERALQESEERYDRIIAVLQVGIVVIDATGTIAACNPSAERILGLSAEQIKGRSLLDAPWQAIHEDGSPFPQESFPALAALRTGRPCGNAVMGIARPDGVVTWIASNAQPLFHANEPAPYAVVTSLEDITACMQTARVADDSR